MLENGACDSECQGCRPFYRYELIMVVLMEISPTKCSFKLRSSMVTMSSLDPETVLQKESHARAKHEKAYPGPVLDTEVAVCRLVGGHWPLSPQVHLRTTLGSLCSLFVVGLAALKDRISEDRSDR